MGAACRGGPARGDGRAHLVGLSRNGWANAFYAAAVQAGTKSWKAFFFGSFDAANFITVDKTPASLWVMEISARIFGLNSWSLLVPQALEGVATVGVLYATVRRWFGPAAGLIAGAVLALTPVATLMFRYDNPDALLVLLLVLAAYAITRAVESGRTRWLALTGALLGFGFLTKMLQAFLVLPVFALVYLIAGPPRLGRRIWQLLVGGAAVVVAAGWWVAIVMLTPAADRPYVGGSTNDSILQLTFGYNGLGRLTGNETGSVGPATRSSAAFGGPAGLTRLFSSSMGGQASWLIPAALIGLVALLWLSRRSPRTDRTRAAALMWGGWLALTGLVFSYMSGIIHPYYTIALAPAIGALTGIAAVTLWRIRRPHGRPADPDRHARGDRRLGVGAARPQPGLVSVAAGGGRARRARRSRAHHPFRAGRGRPPRPGPRVRGADLGQPWPQVPDGGRGVPGGDRRAGGPARVQQQHRCHRLHRSDPGGGPSGRGPTRRDRCVRGAGGARQGGLPRSGEGRFPGGAGRVPGGGAAGAGAGPASAGGQPGAGRFPGGAPGRGFTDGGAAAASGPTPTSAARSPAAREWRRRLRLGGRTVGAESAAPLQLASGDPMMAIGGFNGTDPHRPSPSSRSSCPNTRSTTSWARTRPASAAGPATRRRSPPGSSSTSPARPSPGSPSTT